MVWKRGLCWDARGGSSVLGDELAGNYSHRPDGRWSCALRFDVLATVTALEMLDWLVLTVDVTHYVKRLGRAVDVVACAQSYGWVTVIFDVHGTRFERQMKSDLLRTKRTVRPSFWFPRLR